MATTEEIRQFDYVIELLRANIIDADAALQMLKDNRYFQEIANKVEFKKEPKIKRNLPEWF